MGRLPEIIVVGARKAGTTTLAAWLAQHPAVAAPRVKEPHFFSYHFDDGVGAYASTFSDRRAGIVTFDASASYSHPQRSHVVSSRIADVIPHAHVVYLVREPHRRLRSHYRHEVKQGRIADPMANALAAPANPFVAESRYWASIQPFVDRFPRSRLIIVVAEQLFADDSMAWNAMLHALGLSASARPDGHHNATDARPTFTPRRRWMRRLAATGAGRVLPPFCREQLRRRVLQGDRSTRALLDSADDPIPAAVSAILREEATTLAAWLGRVDPLWPPLAPTTSGPHGGVDITAPRS